MKIKIFVASELEALKEPLLNINFLELKKNKASADIIIARTNQGANTIVVGKDIDLPMRLFSLLTLIKHRMNNRQITFQQLVLDPVEKSLISGNNSIELTEKEIDFLRELFIKQKLTKEELLKQVWGYHEEVQSNTLETHLSKIRGKLAILNYTIAFEDNLLMIKQID